MAMASKQNEPHVWSRSDFEEEFARARTEKRVPQLGGGQSKGDLDLSGLDFTSEYQSPFGPHSAVYIGIDLRGTLLRNCNFERCDFASANLRGTDLSGSNLKGANLYNTLFEYAKVDGADLSDANLVSAEFSQTSFMATILRNARFGRTTIIETDLSGAIGLGEAIHSDPSAIDTRSLRLAAAGLAGQPEDLRQDFLRFLSSAGLDDELIPVVRTWVGRPIEYYSIFISHSSLDKEFARRLYRDLRALGVGCWLDERQILPGDSIMEEVDRGIRLWDRLLLICSRNSLGPTTGWWVEEELERGLAKERELRRSGHRFGVIVPITVDDYVFTEWSSGYRSTILERKVGDFRSYETEAYPQSLRELVAALDRDRHS
jgi:uncharacterized protein YjbI with pentapeptide repeats